MQASYYNHAVTDQNPKSRINWRTITKEKKLSRQKIGWNLNHSNHDYYLIKPHQFQNYTTKEIDINYLKQDLLLFILTRVISKYLCTLCLVINSVLSSLQSR